MAGKFKVRPIAGHEPVPRFIDPDDSSDQEAILKFEAEVRKFTNFLRSLEEFIGIVKGQYNF